MCFNRKNYRKEKFRTFIINEYHGISYIKGERLKKREKIEPTRYNKHDYSKYPPNFSKSSKYTLLSFFPFALGFQFVKATNIYFSVIIAMTFFPSISPFSFSAMFTPFAFILVVSLLREAYEDFLRHRSDWLSNRSLTQVLRKGEIKTEYWKNLKVGDLVIIKMDERIPADLVLISTSSENGVAYLETSTLDGEKHLKPRYSPKETLRCVKGEVDFGEEKKKKKKRLGKCSVDLKLELSVQTPSSSLYKFQGFIEMEIRERRRSSILSVRQNQVAPKRKMSENIKQIPLTVKNFLFKGAKMRNTDWILGIVAYTGRDTKIQINSSVSTSKLSKLENMMHLMIMFLFILQLCFSILSAFGTNMLNSVGDSGFYKFFLVNDVDEDAGIAKTVMRYFLLLNTMIPISLMVNIEVVRLFQAWVIGNNLELKSKERKIWCKVSTATINEELGSIQYVLSDKTGTLTKNKMELRGICVADRVYGGEFVEKNDKISFVQARFLRSSSPKKILTEARKIDGFSLIDSNYPVFDPDLIDLMINKERKDMLPIPKVIKGNLKITYLDQIIEESNSEEEKEMDPSTGRKSGNIKIFNFKNMDSLSHENVKYYTQSAHITPNLTPNYSRKFNNQNHRRNTKESIEMDSQSKLSDLNDLNDIASCSDTDFKSNSHIDSTIEIKKFSQANENLNGQNFNKKANPKMITISEMKHEPPHSHRPLISRSNFNFFKDDPFTKSQNLDNSDLDINSPNKRNPLRNNSFMSQKLSFDINPSPNKEGNSKNIFFDNYKQLSEEFLKCGSLCHEVLIESKNEKHCYQSSSPDEVAICQRLKEIGVEFKGLNLGTSKVSHFGNISEYEVKMVFEFDSERKCQSIVVKDGEEYKLYIKGADSSIIPNLKQTIDQPYLPHLEENLHNFSLLGYRTLVFATRYLTYKEFISYEKKYLKAMNSLNREEEVKKLAREIEKELILLGATAVEDSLQDNVNETITRLLEAGIKVWMITGDKLETAENIGLMAGIITQTMKRYYLAKVARINFKEKVKNLKNQIMKLNKSDQTCIIFDMRNVEFIFTNSGEHEEELNLLAALIMEADAVICARATPKQKARLVHFVKCRKKICLAIGDGANDVNMIGQANIGVGIYGQEGLQAVQASDFALANFRYLWKLILVHGRLNQVRLSKFIHMFFYKNVMYTFPQFLFGFYSYFSGLSLFDEYYLLLYNLVFTSFTVSLLACTDRDINYLRVKSEKELMKEKEAKEAEYVRKVTNQENDVDSSFTVVSKDKKVDESLVNCEYITVIKKIKENFQHYYYISQKSLFFTPSTFFLEIMSSLFQSTAVTLMTTYFFNGETVLTIEGYTADHWCVSFTIYTSILLGSNLTLCYRSREIGWTLIVMIFVTSIIPFFVFMWIYDQLEQLNSDSTYSAITLFRSYHFYLTVFINLMTISLLEVLDLLRWYGIKPTLVEYTRMILKGGKIDQEGKFDMNIIKKIKSFHDPIQKFEEDLEQKKEIERNIALEEAMQVNEGKEESIIFFKPGKEESKVEVDQGKLPNDEEKENLVSGRHVLEDEKLNIDELEEI